MVSYLNKKMKIGQNEMYFNKPIPIENPSSVK